MYAAKHNLLRVEFESRTCIQKTVTRCGCFRVVCGERMILSKGCIQSNPHIDVTQLLLSIDEIRTKFRHPPRRGYHWDVPRSHDRFSESSPHEGKTVLEMQPVERRSEERRVGKESRQEWAA